MSSKAPTGREAPDSARAPRVAAIDVGTNAIRFLAAEVDTSRVPRVLEEKRYALRLGHDVFSTGGIADSTTTAVCAAFTEIRARMDALGVARYRAVATSAVREARNRTGFLRAVRKASGVSLRAITGNEEARLVHTAVRARLPLGEAPWMFMELGGGSVELFVADASHVRWCQTHSLGAVRLLELFDRTRGEPRRFARLLTEYTAALRLRIDQDAAGTKGFIATGGNIESLARMSAARSGEEGAGRVSLSALHALIEELAGMDAKERESRFNLRPDRADVVLPAGIVYAHFAEIAGAREIVVPGVGVREGIVLDLAPREAAATEREETWVVEDAVSVGRRFSFDEAHGRKVMEIALCLFDSLRVLHGLGDEERRTLVAAALLHDIGGFISYKGHHKHSLYLISHAELPGFSRTEILIAANVARYHRKSHPSVGHPEYASLSAAARHRVRVLSSLLRVADALDREHKGSVESVEILLRPDSVGLRARGGGDMLLEQWALRKKAALFQEVFGLPLSMTREEVDA